MWITILLVLIFLGGLGALIWIAWQKWPQVRILDPNRRMSQAKELKRELARKRVERVTAKPAQQLQKQVFVPGWRKMQDGFRRLAGKLTAAERNYQQKQRKEIASQMGEDLTEQFIEEARALMQEEHWDRAEKKLIDVIRDNPKSVDAYETLGRLYFAKRDLDLAKETFTFLTSKLAKEDASAIASLGEVEELLGDMEAAHGHFARAREIRPNNPRYLDFFIRSAIAVKKKKEAKEGLKKLKEVNPDNQKIALFEEEIAGL
jgi:tetratricopeptide (TPR) repeat protein